jgi:integrase
VHGWRSTLKDWATELGYNDTVTEMILAHKVGNDTVRAYRRTDLMAMRTEILEKWNRYLLGEKV